MKSLSYRTEQVTKANNQVMSVWRMLVKPASTYTTVFKKQDHCEA